MNQTIHSTSAKNTQEFARDFARSLLVKANPDTPCLLLYGNLGAGKTTFMQGFAKGLGITQRIISPTFTMLREYEIGFMIQDSRFKRLYHIDLYRSKSEHDLKGLGLEEIFNDMEGIIAIEWPEKLGSFLPKKRIELHFDSLSENEREIRIQRFMM